MAREAKKPVVAKKSKEQGCNCDEQYKALLGEISALWKYVGELAVRKQPVAQVATIHKVEDFNGEVAPMPEDNLKMNEQDKLISIENAVKILPPNMIKDGRHMRENVEAICGFKVSEEQMDAVYSHFSHEAY